MPIVLQLPQVKRNKKERPRECPYCQGETFQRWRQVKKRVKDTRVRTARVYRYRCTSCGRTFRAYPSGVGRGMQSERMKKLAVICWSFGLSYRGLEAILPAFGVCLSRMSAWRDVQEAAEQLRREQNWKAVRVVGIDGAWLNGTGVMVAVDLDTKQPLAIGAIVSDDLGMYRGMVEELELGHQVCHFHVRRWVGKACWELGQKLPEEWLWILEKIKTLLEELPPDAGKQLLRLYCQQLPGHRKRDQTHTAVDQLYAPC